MPIYNFFNTDFEEPDAYYIKSDKPTCTKMDFFVAIFNIISVSLICYYLK